MPEHPRDDPRADLSALIDPLARAAQLVLLLDERQPDAVRADALAMRPERLFWTLTQLDDGLPLAICQALVRAVRLGRGRPIRPDRVAGEVRSAYIAATAARAWAVRRLASLPLVVALDRWLPSAPAGDPAPPASPNRAPVPWWLDLPPLVGPPPGAVDPAPTARLARHLRGLMPGCRHRAPGTDSSHPA
jgi:hypothetical protein